MRIAVAAVVAALLASCSAAAEPDGVGQGSVREQQARGAAGGPQLAGCPVFRADDWWNTRVDDLPVHPRSRDWVRHMSPRSDLHPDFGPSFGDSPVPYGIPITVVDGDHARVRVRFDYADESDHVGYPLGPDTRIEGGRRSDGDRHAIMLDRDRCTVYETYATRVRERRAGSGAVWDLRSYDLRPDGWTSADAAGLPILPGLLRLGEVRTGRVLHAIRFTTDVTDRHHVWPARHDAGSVSDRSYPPMGARFRLRPSFSLAGYRDDTQTVLRAMKRYGLVLADNGSPWYFQGEARRGWPVGMLDELKTIPASAFEAVATQQLMVDPDSSQTRN